MTIKATKKKAEKRGVDIRKEHLIKINADIVIKEKEDRRLDCILLGKTNAVGNQEKLIIENQQEISSLVNELKTKKIDHEVEMKGLDTLFVDKKTGLEQDVLTLENKKKELESGNNNLIRDIENNKKLLLESNIVTAQGKKEKKKLEAKLESLNNSILKSNDMSKKAKIEKELAMNSLADYKKELKDLTNKIAKLKDSEKEAQDSLGKVTKRTDFLVRFADYNESWEQHNKTWCKRVGTPYEPFKG